MIVDSFEINEALQLIPFSPQRVAETHQSIDARIWLDVQDFSSEELETWLDRLEVTGLTRRLGMLTILSAIFMPMTLLAGIWAMNFENMPELTYSFSYPIALGFILLIGVLMYLFFRKGGWFD